MLDKVSDPLEFYDLAGKIYLANESQDSAKAFFLKALELESLGAKAWIDLPDTYTNLAICYLQLAQNDSALWFLNKSLELKEYNPMAYYFLGLHGIQENNLTQACYHLDISEFQGLSIPDNIIAYCKDAPTNQLDIETLSDITLKAQIYTDTIYINKWGRWTIRQNARYARLAAFDIKKNGFYGNFRDFDLSGNLIFSGSYDKEGRLIGLFNAHYPNGQLKASGKYVDGERQGIW